MMMIVTGWPWLAGFFEFPSLINVEEYPLFGLECLMEWNALFLSIFLH